MSHGVPRIPQSPMESRISPKIPRAPEDIHVSLYLGVPCPCVPWSSMSESHTSPESHCL